MPGRAAKDDARLALIGATYHLSQLRKQVEAGLSDSKQQMLFHWHLRAFFWELVAVRDSLKQESKTSPEIKAALDALEESQWFQEVNDYRNFAHQSFHIVEVAIQTTTNRAMFIQIHGRDGDAMPHLNGYCEKMKAFLKALYRAT
jgi:hypothetical protein